MAEAHSAVAFSFSITHEGFDINYDQEVLNLVWTSGVRSWKKRLARFRVRILSILLCGKQNLMWFILLFQNGLRNGIYPAHLQSLWIVIAVVAAFHFTQRHVPFDLVNTVLNYIPGHSPFWEFIACSLTGLVFWLMICYTMRYTLKLLLMYKGWMYESRGKGNKISIQVGRFWINYKVWEKYTAGQRSRAIKYAGFWVQKLLITGSSY